MRAIWRCDRGRKALADAPGEIAARSEAHALGAQRGRAGDLEPARQLDEGVALLGERALERRAGRRSTPSRRARSGEARDRRQARQVAQDADQPVGEAAGVAGRAGRAGARREIEALALAREQRVGPRQRAGRGAQVRSAAVDDAMHGLDVAARQVVDRATSSTRTGTTISAAPVGVGARRSAAWSMSVQSVSWPTAETSGIALSAAARTTTSSLKPHRSSIDPPPRATMSTSGAESARRARAR